MMRSQDWNRQLTALILIVSGCSLASGQIAGSRATEESTYHVLPVLAPGVVESHIAIDGSSQIRVQPTSLRLVWAVIAQAVDAAECQRQVDSQIAAVLSGWTQQGIDAATVVEDFISAIPQFEWRLERQEGEELLIERQVGYRIQVNLHVACDSGDQARQVIAAAMAAGLADLIAVDYTADLATAQQTARREAIAAAKEKAADLLAVFDSPPVPINIQEQTVAFTPDQMYHSFENVAGSHFITRYDDQLRRIAAYRPQNTYYRGLTRAADRRDYQLPMNPEIVVESNVVLYYESPAAKNRPRHDD